MVKNDGARRQLIVARYSPAGNYPGQYAANVLPPAPGVFPDATKEEVFDNGLKDEVVEEDMFDKSLKDETVEDEVFEVLK